ncbi:RNA exonuclease ngl2 [Dispira parvispora]|uniref:RNA exonuclease ngl2 n=1 Tax=Dispira parvispora TaxID=1520584 RepID=A0A9W8E8J0_9FUNG|nr:RNA exonuclease ngl2 [Dispira parvispora]
MDPSNGTTAFFSRNLVDIANGQAEQIPRRTSSAATVVRVMTYNVLAPSLATVDYFPRSAPEHLLPSGRFKHMWAEVSHYQPNILCLQEAENFKDNFAGPLRKRGYQMEYFVSWKGKSHGCCIAWKANQWRKRRAITISLNKNTTVQGLVEWCRAERHLVTTEGCPLVELKPRYQKRVHGTWKLRTGNVAGIVVLERCSAPTQSQPRHRKGTDSYVEMFAGMHLDGLTLPSHSAQSALESSASQSDTVPGLIVVTCHLYWQFSGTFHRLIQLACIFREIAILQQSLGYPVLLVGDFNTIPNDPNYKLLTGQPLEEADLDKLVKSMHELALAQLPRMVNSSLPSDTQLFTSIPHDWKRQYVQQLTKLVQGNFTSIYYSTNHTAGWQGSASEPPYTTYCEFQGTLDYMFWTRQLVKNPNVLTEYIRRRLPKRGPPRFDFAVTVPTTGQSEKDQSDCHSAEETSSSTPDHSLHYSVNRLLQLPPTSVLEPGIPNALFPSDHLCLMVELAVDDVVS